MSLLSLKDRNIITHLYDADLPFYDEEWLYMLCWVRLIELAAEHGQRLSSSASTFWAGPIPELKGSSFVISQEQQYQENGSRK